MFLERVLYRTIPLDGEIDTFIVEVDVYDDGGKTWGVTIGDDVVGFPFTAAFYLKVEFGSTTYSLFGPEGLGLFEGPTLNDGDTLSIRIIRTETGQYTACYYHNGSLLATQSGSWTSPPILYPGVTLDSIGGPTNKGSLDNYTSELHLLRAPSHFARRVPA